MIQKTTFWAAHVAALKLEQGKTGDRPRFCYLPEN